MTKKQHEDSLKYLSVGPDTSFFFKTYYLFACKGIKYHKLHWDLVKSTYPSQEIFEL